MNGNKQIVLFRIFLFRKIFISNEQIYYQAALEVTKFETNLSREMRSSPGQPEFSSKVPNANRPFLFAMRMTMTKTW